MYNQFEIIQVLQRSPIPQTSNWSGPFFAVSYSKPTLKAYCPNIYTAPFDELDDGEPRRAAATTDELEVEDFKVKKKKFGMKIKTLL